MVRVPVHKFAILGEPILVARVGAQRDGPRSRLGLRQEDVSKRQFRGVQPPHRHARIGRQARSRMRVKLDGGSNDGPLLAFAELAHSH